MEFKLLSLYCDASHTHKNSIPMIPYRPGTSLSDFEQILPQHSRPLGRRSKIYWFSTGIISFTCFKYIGKSSQAFVRIPSFQMPANVVFYCRKDPGEDLNGLNCSRALLRFEGNDQVHRIA